MSHQKHPPEARSGGRRPSAGGFVRALLARLERHLVEWPRRYVEMRVDAVDSKR